LIFLIINFVGFAGQTEIHLDNQAVFNPYFPK